MLVALQQVVETGLEVVVKVVEVVVEDSLALDRLEGAEIEVLVEVPAVDVSPTAGGPARVDNALRVPTFGTEPAESWTADAKAVGVEVERLVVGSDRTANQAKGVVVVVVVVDAAAACSTTAKQTKTAVPSRGTAASEIEGADPLLSVPAGEVGVGEVGVVGGATTTEARAGTGEGGCATRVAPPLPAAAGSDAGTLGRAPAQRVGGPTLGDGTQESVWFVSQKAS